MAKNKNENAAVEGEVKGAAAEAATEETEEDATMQVDLDEKTGLPITRDANGVFIPKIPKALFYGDHVKKEVDGWDKKLAFLTYAKEMLEYRIAEHKAIKDPEQAKRLRIAKLQAELARLTK